MKYLILFLCSAWTLLTHAQTGPSVNGRITDDQGLALPGANVSIVRITDSVVMRSMQTEPDGKFTLPLRRSGSILLKFSYVGYEEKLLKMEVLETALNLGDIVLRSESRTLKEIEIKARAVNVENKGDTTEFNARSYKTNPDANAEDLVTKLPGVVVTDGKVQAQGEDVKQVMVDGRPFFGEDANAALRNMPAEVIDRIQIFDRRTDQSLFTGFDDGNGSKTINITTKPEFRNGTFGRAWAGYGTDDRWKTGASVNFFKDKRRITLLGNLNNINEQNFSSEDLAGVLSGSQSGNRGGGPGRGGPGGGGRGPGGRGPGGSGDQFLVDQRTGIVTTRAFGLNYSDKWGNAEVSGSYFFNNSNNIAENNLIRIFTSPDNLGLIYSELNNSRLDNTNHRANFRTEWKIDSANALIFTPRLSLQNTKTLQSVFSSNDLNLSLLNTNNFNNNLQTEYYNFSLPLLYRHNFKMPRRTVSAQFNPSWNNGLNNNLLFSVLEDQIFMSTDTLDQLQDTERKGSNLNSNLSYTEPIGERSMMMLSYTHVLNNNESDQNTFLSTGQNEIYTLVDTSLSNVFNADYQSHNVNLSYRYQFKAINFNVGTAYQFAELKNAQFFPAEFNLNRRFQNILPDASMQWKFSSSKNLRFNYRTSTNQPSIQQLQEVASIANSLSVSSGNSELLQDFRHNIFMRYQQSDYMKGNNLFALLSVSFADHYIANEYIIPSADTLILGDVLLSRGGQWVRPVNLDGYLSLRSFATYGFPITAVKCNLNLNGGISYVISPSKVNETINENKNLSSNLGFVLSSNISKTLDFTLSASVLLNDFKNSTSPDQNTTNYTQNTGFKIQWQIWKGLVIQTDLNSQINSGLSDDLNQNFVLWNAALAYKFLPKQAGDLRLSVFDLLNQNISLVRNVREAYYEDVKTNVLQQYVMLSFTYNLKRFTENKAMSGGQRRPGQ
ncbi:MAG: outer membrane beta-barrel protein [Saprospiraceae bacterium]